MRHLMLIGVLMFCSVCANAEIKFQSLDNKGATHIVLLDDKAQKNVKVTDAVLYCAEKEYQAKQIRCNILKSGTAVYKLTFKRLTFFKDCKISIRINGVEKVIDIKHNLAHK